MAGKYRFVALVNAKNGQDDAFNAWHTERHLPEVLSEGDGEPMAAGKIHISERLGGPLWASMYEAIPGAQFIG